MDQGQPQQPTARADPAGYMRAYRARQAVAPVPAPLRLPLRPVPKPEPERRAVSRPPWRFGMHRVDGVRFGDEDWLIPAESAPANAQPGGGSPRGQASPAPVR